VSRAWHRTGKASTLLQQFFPQGSKSRRRLVPGRATQLFFLTLLLGFFRFDQPCDRPENRQHYDQQYIRPLFDVIASSSQD
jgi:hypothetical protein